MPPFPLRLSLVVGLAVAGLAFAARAQAAGLADQADSRPRAATQAQAEPTAVDTGPLRRLRLRSTDNGAGWSTVYRGGEARSRDFARDRPRPLPAQRSRIGARPQR